MFANIAEGQVFFHESRKAFIENQAIDTTQHCKNLLYKKYYINRNIQPYNFEKVVFLTFSSGEKKITKKSHPPHHHSLERKII